MKKADWIAAMERIAPLELAEDWDNVGLLVGTERAEITRVLVALDCTVAVAREAAERGADLVLTHHPLFFSPVRRLLPDAPETAAACLLLRYGIGLYAAHTNLDAAEGGVNDALARLLHAKDCVPFSGGLGRVGTLERPMTLSEFAGEVKRVLAAPALVSGDPARVIRRAAFVGGSGGSCVRDAATAGADVLVSGEIKHAQALDADMLGLCCIAAGHYETERIVLRPLIERLQMAADDVQYTLAQTDKGPFCAV